MFVITFLLYGKGMQTLEKALSMYALLIESQHTVIALSATTVAADGLKKATRVALALYERHE